THYVSIVMVVMAVILSILMKNAYASATPQDSFMLFMIIFIILFAATGVGNGSTFRTISQVFDQEQAGPVLGWTSAVAAYGAFIMPKVLGEQIKAATPQYALYGFAAYYFVCLVLNYWVYLRKDVKYYNP
ncbi:MAG: antiporter, partial [Deltaproteobacteria bacterium]|nr:antiporter [Deltaproteobacteria bacterium]